MTGHASVSELNYNNPMVKTFARLGQRNCQARVDREEEQAFVYCNNHTAVYSQINTLASLIRYCSTSQSRIGAAMIVSLLLLCLNLASFAFARPASTSEGKAKPPCDKKPTIEENFVEAYGYDIDPEHDAAPLYQVGFTPSAYQIRLYPNKYLTKQYRDLERNDKAGAKKNEKKYLTLVCNNDERMYKLSQRYKREYDTLKQEVKSHHSKAGKAEVYWDVWAEVAEPLEEKHHDPIEMSEVKARLVPGWSEEEIKNYQIEIQYREAERRSGEICK